MLWGTHIKSQTHNNIIIAVKQENNATQSFFAGETTLFLKSLTGTRGLRAEGLTKGAGFASPTE